MSSGSSLGFTSLGQMGGSYMPSHRQSQGQGQGQGQQLQQQQQQQQRQLQQQQQQLQQQQQQLQQQQQQLQQHQQQQGGRKKSLRNMFRFMSMRKARRHHKSPKSHRKRGTRKVRRSRK